MTIREEFESRFPVPEGVQHLGKFGYATLSKDDSVIAEMRNYCFKWIGFQAGWEARGSK